MGPTANLTAKGNRGAHEEWNQKVESAKKAYRFVGSEKGGGGVASFSTCEGLCKSSDQSHDKKRWGAEKGSVSGGGTSCGQRCKEEVRSADKKLGNRKREKRTVRNNRHGIRSQGREEKLDGGEETIITNIRGGKWRGEKDY